MRVYVTPKCDNKIAMIKLVRAITSLGLKEAKDFVEGAWYTARTEDKERWDRWTYNPRTVEIDLQPFTVQDGLRNWAEISAIFNVSMERPVEMPVYTL